MGTLASMFPYREPDPESPNPPLGPKEIWASAAPHMNDVREFSYGKGKLVKALKALEVTSPPDEEAQRLLIAIAEKAKGEDLYCACFSAKADDLGQWRGYGDDGRGCCVGYDLEGLRQAHSWLSGWVVYERESQNAIAARLADELVGMISPHMPDQTGVDLSESARRALARLVPSTFVFFKDPAFREEQEFRLVYAPLAEAKNLPVHFGERRGRIVPYVKLPFEDGAPLREVWIGPHNDLGRTRPAIEHLVRERDLDGIAVKPSKIPYLP